MLGAMAMMRAAKGSDREASARATLIGWALLCGIGCATAPAPAPATASARAPAVTAEPATTSVAPATTPAEPPAASHALAAPEPFALLEPVILGYTPAVAEVLAEVHFGWIPTSTTMAVTRRGAVRLLPNGPDLGLRDQAPFPAPKRLPVLEDAERPRVVIDDGQIRLMLHVDRQDARPVLLREAPLRPTPQATFGDPPTRGHAILQPGAWVDVIATDGAMVQVAYGEPTPELLGWIEAEALGTSFTPPPRPKGARRGDASETLRARRVTKLRVRPGGKVLTAVEADEPVVPITRRVEKGYRLVRHQPMCVRDLVYVGFVRARDLYVPSWGLISGCGRGSAAIPRVFGEAERAPRATLPPGRFLLDVDSPTIVGCVLDEAEVAELGDGRYAVATIWGPVPVRLAPADMRGRCGKHEDVWLR